MEFIIGLQPSPVTLTPNSELLELILISERTSNITVLGEHFNDDHEIISALIFDDGDINLRVRDDKCKTEDTFDVNFFKRSFMKASHHHHHSKLNLKTPFMSRIVMQQTFYPAKDQPHLNWRNITYLRLETETDFIEVGKLREPVNIPGRYVILPEEDIEGPCMITGVGMHNKDLICLQIIQRSFLSSLYAFPEHKYVYDKSKVGLVKLNPEDGFKTLEKTLFVGMEDSDPSVMEAFTKLFNFMASWYSSRSSIHRMFPDLYSLIDKSITEGDRNVIFSTFRLERHLKWRIRNSVLGHKFDGDPFIRLKLYHVVKSLAKTLEKCQRIQVHKPAMDCYTIAYLSGDYYNFLVSIFVLFTQIALTFVLFQSIVKDNEASYFALEESMIVTPIIGIFSFMLVYKQITNTIATFKAYPEMKKHLTGVLKVVANVILGIVILIIQVIIVAKQDNRVEFVLNSIAAIFILELDDSVVFLDDDGITDLNRRMLMKDFNKRIKKIDDRFFDFGHYSEARNFIEINPMECTIQPLPPLHFAEGKQSLNQSLKPVCMNITFQNYTVASDHWTEIAKSDTIAKSILQEDSKAHLRFTWRDQGGGNRKGRLRVRLVHALTGEDVASTAEYGVAPHEEETVQESFDFSHGLLRYGNEGYCYVLEIIVGGGGGHALFLSNFEFKSDAAFVQKETSTFVSDDDDDDDDDDGDHDTTTIT